MLLLDITRHLSAHTYVQLTVLIVAVGHGDALAVITTELPAVKGTLDAVAHYSPTRSQVCSHVWAVGVQHVHLTVLASKHG